MVGYAQKGTRMPEETVETHPHHTIARFCLGSDGLESVRTEIGKSVHRRFDAMITSLIVDDAPQMVRGPGCIARTRADPKLAVGVQAHVFPNGLRSLYILVQPFFIPTIRCLVPISRPLDARQSIHRLKVHQGVETFDVIHDT